MKPPDTFIKKVLVLMPVVALGIFYLYDHQDQYLHTGTRRRLILGFTFLILYSWIFLEVLIRQQQNFFKAVVQASFFVYVFMVLALTGYFILFREVASGDWLHQVGIRLDKKEHVNLELFTIFKIYRLSNRQILGNFLMLFPLGLYLPLLYKWGRGFLWVMISAFLTSVSIEVMQLITRYRSVDVDDIFLNTLGACTGFILYKLLTTSIDKGSKETGSLLVR